MELYGKGRQRAERMIISYWGRLWGNPFSCSRFDSSAFCFALLFFCSASSLSWRHNNFPILFFIFFTWNKLNPTPTLSAARPHCCTEGGMRQEQQQQHPATSVLWHTYTHMLTHTHSVHLSLPPPPLAPRACSTHLIYSLQRNMHCRFSWLLITENCNRAANVSRRRGEGGGGTMKETNRDALVHLGGTALPANWTGPGSRMLMTAVGWMRGSCELWEGSALVWQWYAALYWWEMCIVREWLLQEVFCEVFPTFTFIFSYIFS